MSKEVLNMSLSMTQFWLIAIALLLLVEFATSALTTIWFAGGALAAAIAAFIGAGVPVQIAVFVVVSGLLLYFTRPLVKKKLKVGDTKTNADALIGKTATVITDITAQSPGQVKVGGMEWSAVSADAAEITSGETVTIQAIEGVKLVVSRS
jgi:membrane protein implicated in regulation of membrane protease activity